MTTSIFNLPEIAQAATAYLDHNRAIGALEFISAGVVQQQGLNTPPAVTNGQGYIIGTSPTGAWVGQGENLVYADDNQWNFITPVAGVSFHDIATGDNYRYNGTAWVVVSSGGASFSVNEETLTGNKFLSDGDFTYQVLDPNGTQRDIVLEDTTAANTVFYIINDSDNLSASGNTLEVFEGATATLPSIILDDTTGRSNVQAIKTPTKWILI